MDIILTAHSLSKNKALIVVLTVLATAAATAGSVLGEAPSNDELRLVPQGISTDLSDAGALKVASVALRNRPLAALSLFQPAAGFQDNQPIDPSSKSGLSDNACRARLDNLRAAPKALRKPPAGERADVRIQANDLLVLNFSPFDAELLPHDSALTLLFDDSSVIVLHEVTRAGKIVAASFQLPDGGLISLCDVLAAAPKETSIDQEAKIPQLKIPQAGSH
jgi:hypothetical protein